MQLGIGIRLPHCWVSKSTGISPCIFCTQGAKHGFKNLPLDSFRLRFLKLAWVFLESPEISITQFVIMKKRNWANESSSRPVQCAYCDWKKPVKDYASHCEAQHPGKPVRVKGQLSLAESFLRPKKKPKVAPLPQVQTPDTPTQTQSSEKQEVGLLSQILAIVFSLLAFLNPLRAIVAVENW